MQDRHLTGPAALVFAVLAGCVGVGFFVGEALADGCGYHAQHPVYPGVPSGSSSTQGPTSDASWDGGGKADASTGYIVSLDPPIDYTGPGSASAESQNGDRWTFNVTGGEHCEFHFKGTYKIYLWAEAFVSGFDGGTGSADVSSTAIDDASNSDFVAESLTVTGPSGEWSTDVECGAGELSPKLVTLVAQTAGYVSGETVFELFVDCWADADKGGIGTAHGKAGYDWETLQFTPQVTPRPGQQ